MADHGKAKTYNNGCRCDECRNAVRLYHAARRARLKVEGFEGLTHGAAGTYTAGCRCTGCTRAWRDYSTDSPNRQRYGAATSKAATWVRENHPDVWQQLLDEAEAEQ